MIEEDYVSFETAKLLKEKGFDADECEVHYDPEDHTQYDITLQMAMKWLRYHNWTISVEPKKFLYDLVAESWGYKIWADAVLEVNMSETYQTYEEACEAAIKYCLKNLI